MPVDDLGKQKAGVEVAGHVHVYHLEVDASLRGLLEKCGFTVVYTRHGYKAKNGDPRLKKMIMKHFTDHLYPNSQIVMLAHLTRMYQREDWGQRICYAEAGGRL